jgi:hypothetical protein
MITPIPIRLVRNLKIEKESQDYEACRYDLGEYKVVCRTAKITPTKIGQFVAIWKRNSMGKTAPLETSDDVDLLVIHCKLGSREGQFIFPKPLLVEQGIITSAKKTGKMGLRVYPSWDTPTAKQAINTQMWQLEYFVETDETRFL